MRQRDDHGATEQAAGEETQAEIPLRKSRPGSDRLTRTRLQPGQARHQTLWLISPANVHCAAPHRRLPYSRDTLCRSPPGRFAAHVPTCAPVSCQQLKFFHCLVGEIKKFSCSWYPRSARARSVIHVAPVLARTPRVRLLRIGRSASVVNPTAKFGASIDPAPPAMTSNPFSQHLDKCAANYQPLTPLVFLERAASVFPQHVAVIHGSQRFSYADLYARSRRLASALVGRGIGPGDTVSVMLANTPPMLEAHYGVPMAGAVLHAINTRLDARVVAFQLEHSGSKLVICDREFAPAMREALAQLKRPPIVIDYDDREFPQAGPALSPTGYEALLAEGDPSFGWRMPRDEWEAIALNYTSGTTGNPKGVVYHHRGAHLMCYANVLAAGLGRHPVYLWTLPMFHCNGWCFPVDALRRRRHARLPALGACRGHVRGDCRAQGDAPVRRADRHGDAARAPRRRRNARCRTRWSS